MRWASSFGPGSFATAGQDSSPSSTNLAEKLARVWRGETGEAELDRYDRQRRQINTEYVQTMTIQNKRTIEERDPEVRRRRHDEMRRTAEDPGRARAYLLQTWMIESVRKAARIP
ncbi:MAG TPA: hypothetical protein VGW35_08495 [Methylomirabilota bacterium]|nr:hypothetical protein [Methylomirabilota bacterium]